MAFVFACATAVQGRRFYRSAVFKYCLLATLVFVMTASPYLLFLHKHYGSWVISPKSTYVMIWMKSRIYHDNDKGEMGNDELWGLTPDGNKLRWQEPKGISDLVGYLMSHPGKSLSVYLHNLGHGGAGENPQQQRDGAISAALSRLLCPRRPAGGFHAMGELRQGEEGGSSCPAPYPPGPAGIHRGVVEVHDSLPAGGHHPGGQGILCRGGNCRGENLGPACG